MPSLHESRSPRSPRSPRSSVPHTPPSDRDSAHPHPNSTSAPSPSSPSSSVLSSSSTPPSPSMYESPSPPSSTDAPAPPHPHQFYHHHQQHEQYQQPNPAPDPPPRRPRSSSQPPVHPTASPTSARESRTPPSPPPSPRPYQRRQQRRPSISPPPPRRRPSHRRPAPFSTSATTAVHPAPLSRAANYNAGYLSTQATPDHSNHTITATTVANLHHSAYNAVSSRSPKPSPTAAATAVVPMPSDDQPLSPIPSDHRDAGWQSTRVPLHPDESSSLLHHPSAIADPNNHDLSSGNPAQEHSDDQDDVFDHHTTSNAALLARSRADLEAAQHHQHQYHHQQEPLQQHQHHHQHLNSEPFDEASIRDRYVLGCTIFALAAIVFVIVVSGMTTLLANRNFPQLEIVSDFSNGGRIPARYGCHASGGHAESIPLQWRNVPRTATSLVVIFANPGALTRVGYDPLHWFVTDIPLSNTSFSIPANASENAALLPHGAKQRFNSFSPSGKYWPPCTAHGEKKSLFVIHAYAVEAPPQIGNFTDAREVMNRFVGVPVARLAGYYYPAKKEQAHPEKPTDGHAPAPAPASTPGEHSDDHAPAPEHGPAEGAHGSPSDHDGAQEHHGDGEHPSNDHRNRPTGPKGIYHHIPKAGGGHEATLSESFGQR